MTDKSIAAHQAKTILSKKEFFALNEQAARQMSADQPLQAKAL